MQAPSLLLPPEARRTFSIPASLLSLRHRSFLPTSKLPFLEKSGAFKKRKKKKTKRGASTRLIYI